MEEVMSSRQVADRYGVSLQEVHYALRREKLVAFKAGWVYLFPVKDLPEKWPVNKRKAS